MVVKKKIKAIGSHPKIASLRLKAADGWDVFVDAIKNYDFNGDTNQAAAIALYAILSAIPLFILTIIAAGHIFHAYPHIQANITDAISHGFFSEKLLIQIGQIEHKRKVLGWAGLLALIWLSAAIFDSMATALNIIFRSHKKRNYFNAKLLAISMIPLAWIVGIASVAVSYIMTLLVAQPALSIENLGFSFSEVSTVMLRYIVPYSITTLFFIIVYQVIPTAKVRFRVAAIGSASAALLLEVVKQFFTWYVANYTRYNVIFGSLETVVILVIGVFYVALTFLFCAEMMSSYQRRDILLLEEAILKSRKSVMKIDERLFKKFGRVYTKGSVLFKEGDGGHEMFYILSGRILLEKNDGRAQRVLAELGPGQYFGEMAALIDIRRSATARAVEDSDLAVIDGDTFQDMMRESRGVAVHMLKEFSRRLKTSNAALEELTNLWIRLVIVTYFISNSQAVITDHLPQLTEIIKKEPEVIKTILEELAGRGILIMKNGLIEEVVGNKIWTLLDADEMSKCSVAEEDKV